MKEENDILPINHESNRRGFLLVMHELGLIYEDSGKFYAWPPDMKRGFSYKSLEEAAKHLGLKKPTGCSDYDGKVKLGRLVERGPDGDIYKHQVSRWAHVYYVWRKDEEVSEAMFCVSLKDAREKAGIVIETKATHTLPKSAHPQNQKGYDPHNRK